MSPASGDVTELLARVKGGNKEALAELIPLVYKELRRLAGHIMVHDERAGHTLQPTALVSEAFLRLVGQDRSDWRNRAHFMAVAAQMMRRILVDHAREKKAAKRGTPVSVTLERLDQGVEVGEIEEVLAVDEALARLATLDPQQARVVEMRYFGGLSVEEVGEALEISPRTVKREWAMAKAWLYAELAGEPLG